MHKLVHDRIFWTCAVDIAVISAQSYRYLKL
jgi:hypothetical protein